jgi:predicted metal-binding protein
LVKAVNYSLSTNSPCSAQAAEKAKLMTTWITICDTCKHDDWDAATDAQTHGEQLAALIEAEAHGDVKTRRVSCLMGCTRACNVAIQGEGKLAYTLGNFDPSEEAAAGIVEYAQKHAVSETGQVPFREWPHAIKGHFVTRHQPLPKSDQA